MDSTQATVIIVDADKAQAQADLSEYQFTVGLSSTGEAPATHWMSSGWWYNSQLYDIENTFTWPKRVYMDAEWQTVIAEEGLKVVTESAGDEAQEE